MTTKRYEGHSLGEALAKMRQELGAHSVVHSLKRKDKGWGPFKQIGQGLFEILAQANTDSAATPLPISSPQQPAAHSTDSETTSLSTTSVLAHRFASPPMHTIANELAQVRTEIKTLRYVWEELMQNAHWPDHQQALNTMQQEIQSNTHTLKKLGEQIPLNQAQSSWNQPLLNLYQKLTLNGVNKDIAQRLLEKVHEEVMLVSKAFKSSPSSIETDATPHKAQLTQLSTLLASQIRTIDAPAIIKQTIKRAEEKQPQPTSANTEASFAKTPVFVVLGASSVSVDDCLMGLLQPFQLHWPSHGDTSAEPIPFAKILALEPTSTSELPAFCERHQHIYQPVQHRTDIQQALQKTQSQPVQSIWIRLTSAFPLSQETLLALQTLIPEHAVTFLTLEASRKDEDLNHFTKALLPLKPVATCWMGMDKTTTPGTILNHCTAFRLPILALQAGAHTMQDFKPVAVEQVVDWILMLSQQQATAP